MSRPRVPNRLKLLALAAALLGALALPAVSRAAAPVVTDLGAQGQDGTWTAETQFLLHWRLRAENPAAVVAVHLRVLYGPLEEELEWLPVLLTDEDRKPGREWMSQLVSLPRLRGESQPRAGTYVVEASVQTASATGPPARLTLRVDNRRPGPAVPSLDAAWYRADVVPVLRIAHPPSPHPESGIRGYAVSLGLGAPLAPCAGPDRCAIAETDLAAGIADDALPLGYLPEGEYVASVVAVSNTGMRSIVANTIPVSIDSTRPELSLFGIEPGWSSRPVRVIARASDALSGMAAAGPTGPRTTIAVDGGPATIAQGGEAELTVGGSGVHEVAAGARDAAGNVRGERGLPALTAQVRIDETPPSLAFVRAGDAADPELIEALVTDPLSGPAGGSIGVRPLGSGQAFEPLPTRFADGLLTARWDSDAYPDGSYEFRATGNDGAGNTAISTRRSNGSSLVLANPVKQTSVVRFGFGGHQLVWQRCRRSGESRRCRREVIASFGRRPATRVIPFGRGVRVGGRAAVPGGAPLAGVPVEVTESFDEGAAATTRTTRVLTAADGTFFARLPPGPSRRVEAHLLGSRLLARSDSRALRLGVQAAVHLRASARRAAVGGRPILFSGRVVPGEAKIPAYGRPVQLQFRLPGLPWTEFRTVQTDEHGRFRYPYSFSDDDSRGVRFRFRAFAPPQPGWPYEPAASRPLAVDGY